LSPLSVAAQGSAYFARPRVVDESDREDVAKYGSKALAFGKCVSKLAQAQQG